MDVAVGSALLIIGLSAAGASNSGHIALQDIAQQAAATSAAVATDAVAPAAPGAPVSAPVAAAAAPKPATPARATRSAPADAAAPAPAAPAAAPAAPAPAVAPASPEAPAATASAAAEPPAAVAPASDVAAPAPAAAPALAAASPLAASSPSAQGPIAQGPAEAAPPPPPPTDPGATAQPPAAPPIVDKPAAEAAAAGIEGDEEEDKSGLNLAFRAGMNFGSATFLVNAGYVRNPKVGWSMGFSPSYSFPDSTSIAASASMSQELTKADADDPPNTLLFGDVSLSVGRPLYEFEGGPKLSGSVSALIPTSTASRAETMVTSIGTGVSANQGFGKLRLNLGVSFDKAFHRYTHPTRNPNTGRNLVTRDGLVVTDVVTGFGRAGGSELDGNIYFDGETTNTSMSLGGTIGASYSLTEKLGLGISYGINTSWAYESIDLDEYSSPYATSGRGRRDGQVGSLFVSYRALDNLGVRLGMTTGGGLFSADNKRYRFPFYAFEGAESNLTTFSVNVTYTEHIPL